MTYRGRIRNGSVVLDEPVQLPEGAEVSVDLTPVQRPAPLAELFNGLIGKATGLPDDGSVQHDHYIYGTPKR